MASIYEDTLLFDFYGQLLTDNQQEVLKMHLHEDYSLSEIAELTHVSRQAVHDAITRSERTLQEYESKLHLVEQWKRIQASADRIRELTDQCRGAQGAALEQYLDLIMKQVTEIQDGI